jgi:hypothetical protein
MRQEETIMDINYLGVAAVAAAEGRRRAGDGDSPAGMNPRPQR